MKQRRFTPESHSGRLPCCVTASLYEVRAWSRMHTYLRWSIRVAGRSLFSGLVVCFCRNYPKPSRLVLQRRAPLAPFLERQVPILWPSRVFIHVIYCPCKCRAGLHTSDLISRFFYSYIFVFFFSSYLFLVLIPRTCSYSVIFCFPRPSSTDLHLLPIFLLFYIYTKKWN